MTTKIPIRFIRTASRAKQDWLSPHLAELALQGFAINFDETPHNTEFPLHSASHTVRHSELHKALSGDEQYIWAVRGGYGTSELLPALQWQQYKSAKMVIGFSDISALHSALYTKLGWPSLHAPMPESDLWGKNGSQDIEALVAMLKSGKFSGSLPLKLHSKKPEKKIAGTLFGGCLSVLTNLIGTPYFPERFLGYILFFEDTGENPGRIMRMFEQWRQTGLLSGVQAMILGNFSDCVARPDDEENLIHRQIAKRVSFPVYSTRLFGHCSPNVPIGVGANAQINAGELSWIIENQVNLS